MYRILYWFAALLSAFGAINWGLVAFFKFNLVTFIDKLTGNVGLDKVIYAIVALAGIYVLVSLFTLKS